jgi:hypothetical protein
VIVEHTLGGMQNIRFFIAKAFEFGKHVFEVVIGWFVTADVFSSPGRPALRIENPRSCPRPG